MMILITGGSKCGKSCFAESILDAVKAQKYYLATMKPYGNEALTAIEKHRKMRAEKSFLTVEQYYDIDCANIPDGSAVLLECVGNLLANEMFRDDRIMDCTDKIADDILRLNQRADMLVIVTNQVGSDGISYDKNTLDYIAALGRINQIIAAKSDKVFECVYGIPVGIKG